MAENIRTLLTPAEKVALAPVQAGRLINRPVVLMHTVYDPLIPPQYGVVNFETMIHKPGKDALFVVKYTNGQGHCPFKPQRVAGGFRCPAAADSHQPEGEGWYD